MFRVRRSFFVSLALLIPLLGGCGYHFVGMGGMPRGVKKIAICTLDNATPEPHLGEVIASALRREFITRRGVEVVGEGEAEAILKGKVTSFKLTSLAYDRQGRAKEYRARVVLDLELTSKEGDRLWGLSNFSWSKSFTVYRDVMIDEQRKNWAIDEIADDLAEAVYLRMTEEF